MVDHAHLIVNFDPVFFSIGPLDVRWYSLAYIVGIIWAWLLVKRMIKASDFPITSKKLDDFVGWVVLGIILGGRLGYVLFYQASYYLSHPIEILYLWQGGMSFHGGLIGVAISVLLFVKKEKINLWKFSDMICCVAPVGLFLGRIANFINGELYGAITDKSWGMIFPKGGFVARHPSQLYEAFFEGVVLFCILNFLWWKKKMPAGIVTGLFFVLYGIFRFMVEFVRIPDEHLGYLTFNLTMGQWLCVPMIVFGLGVILWCKKEKKAFGKK